MRLLTTNKFFRCFRHILLLLPMMFVLASCAYVIANPNAKDSFYGEIINEELIVTTTSDNVTIGSDYYFNFLNNHIDAEGLIYYSNFELISTNISNLPDLSLYNRFRLVWADNRVYLFFYGDNVSNINYNSISHQLNFKFTMVSYSIGNHTFTECFDSMISQIIYNEYSYLNNVFEYSMYQFNQVGFGKFDFMSWFIGIFNDQPNVYTNFLNSYFNYYLLVEIVAFAPSIIHLFVHLVEGFIEKISPTPKEDD